MPLKPALPVHSLLNLHICVESKNNFELPRGIRSIVLTRYLLPLAIFLVSKNRRHFGGSPVNACSAKARARLVTSHLTGLCTDELPNSRSRCADLVFASDS